MRLPLPRSRGWARVAQSQPLLWLALGAVVFAIRTHQVESPQLIPAALEAFCWAGTGALTCLVLVAACARLGLERRSLLPTVLLLGLLSIAMSPAWFAMEQWALHLLGQPSSVPLSDLRPTDWSHGSLHRVLVVLLLGYGGLVVVVSEAARRARELLIEARIAQLRGQLNPHFLFNSLNAAMALVEEDAESARTVLLRLSQLLRQTLSAAERPRVSLDGELEWVRCYLEIEKIRFEDMLLVREDIDPATLDLLVPPFLLMPLVENAIKHGLPSSPTPLVVAVRTSTVSGGLEITVCNTGVLGTSGEDATGISTLRQRLAAELGRGASFELVQEGEQVRATLWLEREP